jgi:hypothetical protein
VPRELIWCIRSYRFICVANVPVRLIALALFTRMSMPPELLHRLGHRLLDALLVADVAGQRQALPPAFSISSAAREDRPGQSRIGFHRLGGDGDIGARRRARRSAMPRPMPRLAPVDEQSLAT